MSTSFPTFLGRSWRLRNESSRPDEVVTALIRFALDATGGLSGGGTVLVKDPRADRDSYSGEAADRTRHRIPEWVGGRSRYYMRLTCPRDDWDGYGKARVCWHSTQMRKLSESRPSEPLPDGGTRHFGWDTEYAYAQVEKLAAAGHTRLGRWPIYRVHDWRELFLHLAAHEAAHLLQYDRDRGSGGSELFCEDFALDVLTMYREQLGRPCGDEPVPLDGAQSPILRHVLPAGLVTGPAPAESTTNRKEQSMTASTPTASTEANPMQDLFTSLLDEATQVADSTAKVEKSAYVRVDVLLDEGKKHKTLAYVNLPSSKAVRVEVPKKGGGGYDVIRVTKPAEVAKAIKAIKANHDRIVAATA